MILLRPAPGPEPFEVYMVRRHHGMAFMAGAYVFPGGKLDPTDQDPRLRERLVGARVAGRLEPTPGRDFSRALAEALCVAAIRELYEEAGVLLVRRRGSTELLSAADALFSELLAARDALNAKARTFADIVTRYDLELAADALAYVGHWVTPSLEARRFDARFFLAQLPAGQSADIGSTEHTEQRWLGPKAAVADHDAGVVLLPPPTLGSLWGLTQATSLADLWREAALQLVRPVMPKVGTVGEDPAILFPWDPLYAAAPGEAFPETAHDPRLVAGFSRVVMRNGLWRPGRG